MAAPLQHLLLELLATPPGGSSWSYGLSVLPCPFWTTAVRLLVLQTVCMALQAHWQLQLFLCLRAHACWVYLDLLLALLLFSMRGCS